MKRLTKKNFIFLMSCIISGAIYPLIGYAADEVNFCPTNNGSELNNSPVNAISTTIQGDFIIGGAFRFHGETEVGHIAKFSSNGTFDNNFKSIIGEGFGDTIYALAATDNGSVYIGGNFIGLNHSSQTLPVNRIAKLYEDGQIDDSFTIGEGFDKTVYAIENIGKYVLIGGAFTQYNTTNANRIIQLREDGSIDDDFLSNIGNGFNGTIYSIAVQSDGYILVGGDFTEYNGYNVNYLVRLQPNGVIDEEFSNNIHINDVVYSIEINQNGDIFIGGEFTQYNGKDANHFVVIDNNGDMNMSFDMSVGFNAAVRAIHIDSENRVLIGGKFDQYNNKNVPYFIRLLEGGSIDDSLHIGAGFNNTVNAINSSDEGNIIAVGGSFTEYNTKTKFSLAILGVCNTESPTICGSAASIPQSSFPNSDLCATGAPLITFTTPVSYNNTIVYSWKCIIPNEVKVCTTPAIINGICGSSYNTCTAGTPGITQIPGGQSDVLIDNNMRIISNTLLFKSLIQTRTCVGINSGSTATCTISDNPNLTGGICGTANGGVSNDFPSSNLCLLGVPFGQTISSQSISGGQVNYSIRNTQYPGPNNSVWSTLATTGDGFFAVGQFNTRNNTGRNGIAKLNGDGTLDPSWNGGVGPARPGYITDISYTDKSFGPNSKFIVVGNFTTYNGFARNRIAKLNADGSLDSSWSGGTGVNNIIYSTSTQEDGKIYVAGAFTTYNDIARKYIARLNADGSLDSSWSGGSVGANGYIYSVRTVKDGKIIIAGNFTTYNGITRNYIARLNSDGSLDSSFNLGTTTNGVIYKAHVSPLSDEITLAGSFTTYNGTARKNLAVIVYDSSTNSYSLDPYKYITGTGTNAGIYTARFNKQGAWILGGPFSTYNGLNRTYFTLSNTPHTNLLGPNNQVLALKKTGDKTLVGGTFTTYHGIARKYIARLNADGSLDSSWSGGSIGANHYIYGISQVKDNKFYVGGQFTTYNNIARKYIARLNADGSLDSSWSGGSIGANNIIRSLFETTDGKVFIAGDFTTYNGIARKYIARLNADGSLDSSWSGGIGANTNIYNIKLLSDSKILIVGNFTTYNGIARKYIARLNADGSLDSSWSGGSIGANGYIYGVSLQSDNKIIIGGNFTTYNNIATTRLARLNADGSLDSSRVTGVGPNNMIYAIEPYNDTNVIAGGNFTLYNGVGNGYLIPLHIGSSLDIYSWWCNGGATSASCQSYSRPSSDMCIPYTGSSFNNTVVFPGSAGINSDSYFGEYSKTIDGAVSPDSKLRITLTDLNAYRDQFIEYKSHNSSRFYGCNPDGWNIKHTNNTGAQGLGQSLLSLLGNIIPGTESHPRGPTIFPNPPFLAWKTSAYGFDISCQICISSQTNTGDLIPCTGLPAHAIPNIATDIIQYYDNGNRYPSSLYNYDTTPSNTSCNFICENNYTRDGTSCIPVTRQISCQGILPANAVLIEPGNTFTQTWNGTGWIPSAQSYFYTDILSVNPSDNECAYMCKNNYLRNGSSCVPATNTTTCDITNFSIPNAIIISTGTFSTIRNGNQRSLQNPSVNLNWQYTSPGTYPVGGCYYTCNDNAIRSNNLQACVLKTYHREVSTGQCDAISLPINGLCGIANNSIQSSMPGGISLCFVGTPTVVTGTGPWFWSCLGNNGGSNASCGTMISNPTPINGICGPGTSGQEVTVPTGTSGCYPIVYNEISSNYNNSLYNSARSVCGMSRHNTKESCINTSYGWAQSKYNGDVNGERSFPAMANIGFYDPVNYALHSNGSTSHLFISPDDLDITGIPFPVFNSFSTDYATQKVLGPMCMRGTILTGSTTTMEYPTTSRTVPTTNLCTNGIPSEISLNTTNNRRERQCLGSDGGTNSSCRLHKSTTDTSGQCVGTYTQQGFCGPTTSSEVIGSTRQGNTPGPREGMLCQEFEQNNCGANRGTHGCSWQSSQVTLNCNNVSESNCGNGIYSTCSRGQN